MLPGEKRQFLRQNYPLPQFRPRGAAFRARPLPRRLLQQEFQIILGTVFPGARRAPISSEAAEMLYLFPGEFCYHLKAKWHRWLKVIYSISAPPCCTFQSIKAPIRRFCDLLPVLPKLQVPDSSLKTGNHDRGSVPE